MTTAAKTFSVLTKKDLQSLVPLGCAGPININIDKLPKDFPPDVYATLKVLRATLSRELEAGCRPIIATFLGYAVQKARATFGAERLAVHSEVSVPNIPIPKVGLVGGTLDFMTSPVIGKAPMGTKPFCLH